MKQLKEQHGIKCRGNLKNLTYFFVFDFRTQFLCFGELIGSYMAISVEKNNTDVTKNEYIGLLFISTLLS